jgi:ribosome-associated toxin RatA of RatAB toxin-antitoxin module
MHTENTVYMRGPKSRIFQLAADIQHWPELLPHYTEVLVFEQSDDGTRKVVEMAAIRNDFPYKGRQFPVRWQSVQICEPETGRIYFKHLAGVALGMWVVWTLKDDPWGRGTQVTISHDLTYPLPFLNGWFARNMVGNQFVHAIAGRTLAVIKAIVEKEAQEKEAHGKEAAEKEEANL